MASYCNLTYRYSSTQHLHRSVSTCLSDLLIFVVSRCLEKLPHERYQDTSLRWPFVVRGQQGQTVKLLRRTWSFNWISLFTTPLSLPVKNLLQHSGNLPKHTFWAPSVYGNGWWKRGILPGIWFAVDSSRWGGWEANNWQVTSFEMLLVLITICLYLQEFESWWTIIIGIDVNKLLLQTRFMFQLFRWKTNPMTSRLLWLRQHALALLVDAHTRNLQADVSYLQMHMLRTRDFGQIIV